MGCGDLRPNCRATGLGSAAHTDPVHAVNFVLEVFRDVPFWPQLPRRTFPELQQHTGARAARTHRAPCTPPAQAPGLIAMKISKPEGSVTQRAWNPTRRSNRSQSDRANNPNSCRSSSMWMSAPSLSMNAK